jgi:FaeA-like protein
VTPAALLSGVPKKQHHKTAVGGLLRQIGEFGIISLKDFGSILSMRPDAKAEVLAALREVFDGSWTRLLGTEGGRTLAWQGKVGLVFGCTGVIDGHYSVIGAMGDRFLLCRLGPSEGQFSCSLKHSGAATGQMRKELAEAVARLFAGDRPDPRPLIIGGEEFQRLDRIVSLVVRLRGAIERDRQSREIEAIYGAEGTARLGLTLERLLAGLDTLGIDRTIALNVVEAVAMDSIPPLRRSAFEHLKSLGCHAETAAVAKVLGLPTVTVRRALEDLAAYHLVERITQGQGKPDLWAAT